MPGLLFPAFQKFYSSLCSMEEYVFDGEKLSNMEYIAYQVMNGKKKKLDLGKVNMSPLVEAFQKRMKEH